MVLFRARWIVRGLIVALACVALFLAAKSLRTQPRESAAPMPPVSPPIAPPEKPTPPPTIKKDPQQRRDREAWPQTPHAVALRHRSVLPSREPELGALPSDAPSTWIAQFGGPLDAEDRERLDARGIRVLFPTDAMAFHVRASHQALTAAAKDFAPSILGWARLDPADRILDGTDPIPVSVESGRRLELYPGENAERVAHEIAALGGRVTNFGIGWIDVSGLGNRDFSLQLAAIDGVYAVEAARPRKRAMNEFASFASAISPLQGAPRNLSGQGITILVRDEGCIFAHPDFGTRLRLGPDVNALSPVIHATHVAGTVGGTGAAGPTFKARGMATGATLVSFDLDGDDVAEVTAARNSFGAILSNHSYGFVIGWDGTTFNNNQALFGQYSTFARNWDSLIRSENLLIVKAVGNDRNDNGPNFPHDGTLASDGEYYDCVDSSSTGKNYLLVGAAQDTIVAGTPTSTISVIAASSAGPCNDGRLKPEIVANGENVSSCSTGTSGSSQYTILNGTSMSAAVVTGATALFLEAYKQRTGASAFPPPHYVRALYAQTATDLGRAGPDYLHGFGMLDLSAAISLFDADVPSGSRLLNSSVSAAVPERFFRFTSDGSAPIRATLCWTDEFGDVLAQKAIINDLDLRLVRAGDQAEFLPFKLDPLRPSNNATTGINAVDTIEQVVVSAPLAGDYLLVVRGSTLATPAAFTLASALPIEEVAPPVARISTNTIGGNPPLNVVFDGSASIDPDGTIVSYNWDFGDEQTGSGAVVPHTYTALGQYTAKLTVIDNSGASSVATQTINVTNVKPQVVVNATPPAGLPPLTTLLTSAGTNDPDGQVTSFAWNFGDGTTATGADVTHTYAAPGLYFVSLKVTDNVGESVEQNAVVLAGQEALPFSARFSLNFAKIARDGLTFSFKKLPILAISTAGMTGSVRIGTVDYPFTLDEKGKFKALPLTVQYSPTRGTLKVSLTNTSLQDAVAVSGATNRDAKKTPVALPFAVTFSDGTLYGSSKVPFLYTSKLGKTGRATLVKP